MQVKLFPHVVISGSIAIDRIMNFTGSYSDYINPEKLESLSISIFLDNLINSQGGVGANIAYSLALLGEQPTLLGSIGKDGLTYMDKLARLGVDTSHIFESKLSTASFNVMTDSNQNQVGGFYPGAMFDSHTLSLTPWKEQSPIVVVAPHDPKAMRRQVQECKEWGLRLCYDIGQQVSNLPTEDIRKGVEACEILILNDYELSILCKKIDQSVESIKQLVPIVVTTLGKDGSIIEGSSVSAPVVVGVAIPKQVADPTGAGDAFRAGFLYGFVRQWPLKACAQLGAVCGTYAIEEVGTQTHTFTMHEVQQRYVHSFHEELPSK